MQEETASLTWSWPPPPAHTWSVPPQDQPAVVNVPDAGRRSVTQGSTVAHLPPSTFHLRNAPSLSRRPTASEPRLQTHSNMHDIHANSAS